MYGLILFELNSSILSQRKVRIQLGQKMSWLRVYIISVKCFHQFSEFFNQDYKRTFKTFVKKDKLTLLSLTLILNIKQGCFCHYQFFIINLITILSTKYLTKHGLIGDIWYHVKSSIRNCFQNVVINFYVLIPI